MQRALQDLGPRQGHQPDGASQEGVSYAGYGLQALLRALDLSDSLLGTGFQAPPQPAAAWFQLAPAYYLYTSLPAHAWQSTPNGPNDTALSLGDNPSHFSRGPDYLLRRLAGLFPDGPYAASARGLAALTLDRAVNGHDDLTWLNFLWNGPPGPVAPPATLPTLHVFDDYGLVSTRSDWSGDESLLVFMAGPPMGWTNLANPDVYNAPSHVHPYQNSFYIFAAGNTSCPISATKPGN